MKRSGEGEKENVGQGEGIQKVNKSTRRDGLQEEMRIRKMWRASKS